MEHPTNTEPPTCAAIAQTDATPAAENADSDETDLADWQTFELTNVITGETFTINDYAGCATLVQAMATWCPSCRSQLENVAAASTELDGDKVVLIALSVEPDLPDDALRNYAEANGFEMIFAVAPLDMMKALDDAFGRSVLTPPATPHIFISADGEVSELVTGGQSSEDIVRTLTEISATEAS